LKKLLRIEQEICLFVALAISPDQSIEGVSHFDRYLIVENAQGRKKVIIPKLKAFDPPKVFSEDIGKKIHYDGSTTTYEIIDIDESSKPIGNSPKKALLLAYCSLVSKNYVEASRYLKNSYSFHVYTEDEKELLDWIIFLGEEGKDFHPNAIAIRNYAGWLFDENQRQHVSDAFSAKETLEDEKRWQKIGATYGRYLNISHNVDSLFRMDTVVAIDDFRVESQHWVDSLQQLQSDAYSVQEAFALLKELREDEAVLEFEKMNIATHIYSELSKKFGECQQYVAEFPDSTLEIIIQRIY
jgi:hypothetical protein